MLNRKDLALPVFACKIEKNGGSSQTRQFYDRCYEWHFVKEQKLPFFVG